MSEPNKYPCEICGHSLEEESCYCPKCKTWLCDGCVFEDECDERQE